MKMVKSMYYNGSIEGLIILAFLAISLVSTAFSWNKLAAISIVMSLLIWGIWARSVHLSRKMEHKMFVYRKTPFGTFINQSIKGKLKYTEIRSAFEEDFKRLPNGTYITLTHDTIVKLIEKAAKESRREVEIIKSEPIKMTSLYTAKRELSKHTGRKRPFKLSNFFKKDILMTGYIVKIS